MSPFLEVSPQPSSLNLVGKHLHETLCTIETLYELGQFQGSARRVFELIERCSPHRPVSFQFMIYLCEPFPELYSSCFFFRKDQ